MNIKLKISGYDHEGRGIGRYNEKIVFVPNTVIDEEVEVEITKDKKSYAEGEVVNYLKTSPRRIEAICPYYDKCGGCAFWHLDIKDERKIKEDTVKNIIKKYADLDIEPNFIESDRVCNYRNKIGLKIVNGYWGYYNSESHDFISIHKCLIAKESINKIIENKEYLNIKNGSIIIRSNYNDEIILKVETNEDYSIHIDKLIKDNKIVGIIVNGKVIYGEDFYYERVGGYLFKVNINSFFQVNLDILAKVFELLNLNNYQNVVDLYCGVGTLGMAVNKNKLYGIEIVYEAVKDAIKNSKLNKQDNLYMLGDSSKIAEINDKIDTIIVDPPRSGLSKKTLNNILNTNADNLIYMSCNPMTLARDLNLLKEKYEIKEFYILEMFPRTKHVETFCILNIKL